MVKVAAAATRPSSTAVSVVSLEVRSLQRLSGESDQIHCGRPIRRGRSEKAAAIAVLLALMPLLVLVFLIAFEKRSAVWGVLLGLVAAAATLTIYSGLIGLFAIGLAALLHRDRGRFFTSPAPYWAAAVYLVALSPHIVWLIERDFSSLRYAAAQARPESAVEGVLGYLSEQALWYAMPLVGATLALWPLRW